MAVSDRKREGGGTTRQAKSGFTSLTLGQSFQLNNELPSATFCPEPLVAAP